MWFGLDDFEGAPQLYVGLMDYLYNCTHCGAKRSLVYKDTGTDPAGPILEKLLSSTYKYKTKFVCKKCGLPAEHLAERDYGVSYEELRKRHYFDKETKKHFPRLPLWMLP